MEFKGSIIELASKSTAGLDKHTYSICVELEKFVKSSTHDKYHVCCSRTVLQGRTVTGTMSWGELPFQSFSLDLDNKAELSLWPLNDPTSVRQVFDLAQADVADKLELYYKSIVPPKADYRESLYNKANDDEARYAITVAAAQFARVLNENNVLLVYDDSRQDFAVVPKGVKVSCDDGGIPNEEILDEWRFLHVDLPVAGCIFLNDHCLTVAEDYSE